MRTLAKAGTAIILVTHELADIVPEIRRVVLMNRGRIVADGPKKKFFRWTDWRRYSASACKWRSGTGTITCGNSAADNGGYLKISQG